MADNYTNDGISPTLTDMQGGNRQPKIMIKNATKQGYDIATIGDSVNLQQPNSETRRGRVGHEISQTLQTSATMGIVTGIVINDGTTTTITSRINDSNHFLVDNLRIRKLTPKECWRLMGFTDEEFEKAEKVNSNAQLYKQAGNSIVVNVLEKKLKNLIGEKNAKDNNTLALQKIYKP